MFRFVNVVDLMRLNPAPNHPHGMTPGEFTELFTEDAHVVFAFHGYSTAVHGLVHGQTHEERFHVRGYREQGTTTTPFDMVVLNEMSRFHLAIEVLRRARRIPEGATGLAEHCQDQLDRHHALRARAPGGHPRDPRLDLAGVSRPPACDRCATCWR